MAAPRSGTRTFAALLRQAELDIGHEQFGSDGCVSSYLAVRGQIEHIDSKLDLLTLQHEPAHGFASRAGMG